MFINNGGLFIRNIIHRAFGRLFIGNRLLLRVTVGNVSKGNPIGAVFAGR